MDRIASQLKTFDTSLGKPSWERTFSQVPKKGQLDNRTPSWLKTDMVPVTSVAKGRQALQQRCSSIEWDFSEEEEEELKGPIVFAEESRRKRNKVQGRQDDQRKSRDHTRKTLRRSRSRSSSKERKVSQSLSRSSSIEWGFSDDENETSNKKKQMKKR